MAAPCITQRCKKGLARAAFMLARPHNLLPMRTATPQEGPCYSCLHVGVTLQRPAPSHRDASTSCSLTPQRSKKGLVTAALCWRDLSTSCSLTPQRDKTGLAKAALHWRDLPTSCPGKPQRDNVLPRQTSRPQKGPCYSCVASARACNVPPSQTSTRQRRAWSQPLVSSRRIVSKRRRQGSSNEAILVALWFMWRCPEATSRLMELV